MYRRDRDVIFVTIANAGSVSGEINVAGREIVGIVMPAAWTAAGISFQALVDGTTPGSLVFGAVADAAGNEITLAAAAAGRYLVVNAGQLRGLGRIKVISGTNALNVAQGAQRIIGVVVLT